MVPQITINDRTNWNQSFFANLWGVFFGLHKNDLCEPKQNPVPRTALKGPFSVHYVSVLVEISD